MSANLSGAASQQARCSLIAQTLYYSSMLPAPSYIDSERETLVRRPIAFPPFSLFPLRVLGA
jgi:hypothetical protein